MATVRRVIPWLNSLEYEAVYKDLFSDDKRRQLRGLSQISVWRSRDLHKLPVAIDSTAALMRVYIDHQMAEQEQNLSQVEYSLRSTYSLALIRLVNQITERGQQKYYAQPVHVLAEGFGLPEWIVELRHTGTHGHLPSIVVLKAAAKWAINWLKTEYWDVQLKGMSQSGDRKEEEDCVDRLREVLTEYRDKKLEQLNRVSGKEVNIDVLESLRKKISPDRLASCLLEDGFLIPTKQQLQNLCIDLTELMSHTLDLPEMLILFWKPVLKIMLCDYDELVQSFLLHLVAMVTDKKMLRNRLICGWLQTLITCSAAGGKKKAKRVAIQLYKNTVQLPVKRMLEICLAVPSIFMVPVIKQLLSLHKSYLCTYKVVALKKFLDNLYHQSSPTVDHMDKEVNSNPEIHTIQEIISDLNMEVDQTTWQLCDDLVKWEDVPIGILPEQNLQTLSINLKYGDCGIEQVDTYTSGQYVGNIPINHRTENSTEWVMAWNAEKEDDMGEESSQYWTNSELQTIKTSLNIFQ